MSKREIIVATGTFSKLSITLDDTVVNELSLIEKEDNPLGRLDKQLHKMLHDFEKTYFKLTSSNSQKGKGIYE